MTDICPDGYVIIRIGWVREPIGYKPMADPGRSDYEPFKMPEPVYSDPKRYIDIKLIDDSLSHEMRIWDDKTAEFDRYYTEFKEEDEKRYKQREELESKCIDTRVILW